MINGGRVILLASIIIVTMQVVYFDASMCGLRQTQPMIVEQDKIENKKHTKLRTSHPQQEDIEYKVESAEEFDLSVHCQKKYILLSTQRSGSTWTCDLLQQQDGISCGGRSATMGTKVSELLIKYSFEKSADAIWLTYKKDLDSAFAEACQYNPAGSIGFKLMYNQIPPQFLEEGNLETYMRENGVSFLHLVREAKVLKLASSYNVKHQKSHHTTNTTVVKNLRDTPKLPWNGKIIDEMLKLEDISVEWQTRIHFMPLVPDYYLSYESLLNKEDRLNYIGQITAFLTNRNVNASTIQTNGNLLQLHEPLCSDRVENYEKFRMHDKVRGSRSAAACDMIQFHFGGDKRRLL